jgi:signal transduction histidine kinase
LQDLQKLRVSIAAAQEGVDRGLQLTSRLLAFARSPEHDAPGQDVNELLRSQELFLRYGAGPGIRVVLDLAQGLPACAIDPVQFNAAVLNLVVNARDAMPAGGMIQIGTEPRKVKTGVGLLARGSYVAVRVRDSGHGMRRDVLPRIFDPFFTTKGEKGTGLGLPQVCAYMRAIGGHIEVASKPGAGTTVNLLIPASRNDRPVSTSAAGPA